jgi:ankyrin repeat protein
MKKSKYYKSEEAYQQSLDKLDSAAEDGDLKGLQDIISSMDIRDLRRTQTSEEVLIPNMILVETYWNALHIALYRSNLDVARFLLEDCRIDAAALGRLAKDSKNVDRTPNVENESFPLFLTILEDNIEAFNYLWIEHEYFWNTDHLKAVISLIDEKDNESFAAIILNNKTSHDMFNYLSLDEKIEFMKWLASKDRKYYKIYRKHLTKKPFRWAYLVYRSKSLINVSGREAEELQKIGEDIKQEELEMPEDDKVGHYHTLIKGLAKMDEDNEHFKIFKSATSKLIEMPEYEKYKAGDDRKLLTEVSEDGESVEDNKEDQDLKAESDSEDEDWVPSSEEFCELAESGDLKKIKLAVSRIKQIDIIAMTGYEKVVTVGEDEHNTELWNPLLFAINANKLDVVKYFIDDVKVNLRLAMASPDKRDIEYDDINYLGMTSLDEIQGILISVQNQHLKMFDYLWDANFTMWTSGHLLELLRYLLESEWMEGLVHFMEARVTHEIFIVLEFDDRKELFDEILEIIEAIDDEDIQTYMYAAMSVSPFSINMIINEFPDKEMNEYIEKSKGHFKEAEFNYIIFKNEVEIYKKIFEKKKFKDLSEELTKAQAFNQTHYRIQIENSAVLTCTPHTTEIPLFAKEPKFTHLNFHKLIVRGGKEDKKEEKKGKGKGKGLEDSEEEGKVSKKGTKKVEESEEVVEEKGGNKLYQLVQDKELLNFLNKDFWSIPGLALLVKNTELFNSFVKNYRPMLSLLFPLFDEPREDNKKREFASEMQAIIQFSDNLDVLFNALENHSEMFVFQEVHLIIKNALTHGSAAEVKLLNSITVRSYFNFINEDSKLKLIEEMYDWADENKETLKALGPVLATPTYLEYLKKVRPEIAADLEDNSQDDASKSSASEDDEENSSEEDDEEASDDESDGDDEENESSDEDDSESQ